MRAALALIVFLLAAPIIYAQDRYRIATTELRNGYRYIPPSAVADTTDGVLDTYSLWETRDKKEIRLSWFSDCTDGSYNLAITPEQIFFYSSHENPNPNSLYWVAPLSPDHYGLIRSKFSKQKRLRTGPTMNNYRVWFKKGQATKFPTWWDDASMKNGQDTFCSNALMNHLDRYIEELNGCIPANSQVRPLPHPSALMETTPKPFYLNREELIDRLNSRRKRQK